MSDRSPDGDTVLPAGAFSAWVAGMLASIVGDVASDVPCGGCTACCRSGQFVHIEPDETETLSRIPKALLFPAPQRPRGHVVLGYDERGHCPMLIDDRCSIYEHRPRTCRAYDCRVFAAAGIDPDQHAIAQQAERWRFDHPTDHDAAAHDAVRRAATFVRQHPHAVAESAAPIGSTHVAVLAVQVHDLFLGAVDPDPDDVLVEISARRGA